MALSGLYSPWWCSRSHLRYREGRTLAPQEGFPPAAYRRSSSMLARSCPPDQLPPQVFNVKTISMDGFELMSPSGPFYPYQPVSDLLTLRASLQGQSRTR